MSSTSAEKGAADTDSTADTEARAVRKKFFGGLAAVIWCLALFWALVAVIGFIEGSGVLLLVLNLVVAAAVAGFGILLLRRGRSEHGADAVGAEQQLQERLRDQELRSQSAAHKDTQGSDSDAGDQ